MKWVGGATCVVLAALLSVTILSRSPDAREAMGHWLKADDPVVEEPVHVALARAEILPDPDYVAEPVLQELPAYDAGNPFVIKRILPIEGPIKYGEWHWDDEGVPDGPLVMTVDLQARVISVFRDGYEIGAAAALLGTPEHPTPVGSFPILTKERHNVSEKYNNAPMPWTLRLTWDGVAIHGGSDVERGYASHGCIGVPDEFASRLFDIAGKGDVVIITDGQKAGVGSSLAS